MYLPKCADYDFAADPLVFHGKTRARNASEYMKVTEWIVANMSKFNFPVISFCSENDTMCDPDGSRMLIDQSQVSARQCEELSWAYCLISKSHAAVSSAIVIMLMVAMDNTVQSVTAALWHRARMRR